MFKKYILPSIYIISVLLIGAGLSRFQIIKVFYRERWEATSPESVLKKYETAFFDDRALFARYDIFKPSKGTKDDFRPQLKVGKQLSQFLVEF